jgi:hypothetical protein
MPDEPKSMPDGQLGPSPRRLAGVARPLEVGLLAIGAIHASTHLLALTTGPNQPAAEMLRTLAYALNDLILAGLGAWVGGRLIREVAARGEAADRQAGAIREATERMGREVVAALGRIAGLLEANAQAPARADDGRASALAGVRRAIDEGRWRQAETLARAFERSYPDAPEARWLGEEVSEGKQVAVDGLRARLDAARGVGDAEAVLSARDELAEHLQGDPRRDLDRQVVSWLMGVIRKGLAQVPVRPEVVELATRVAEHFAETSEGASLRKALPVLRRSVGLCPRCARPYAGEDDACPECLGTVTGPTLALATVEPPLPDGPRPSVFEEAGIDGEAADEGDDE